jgi:hypothetical protein
MQGGEDKIAEHKGTCLDSLKAARKHICQCDTENGITVMSNKVENGLYKLKVKNKQDSYSMAKESVTRYVSLPR